jgi:hypothetical protein
MRQLELSPLIAPGAEVCDLEGHRVGTVARVHRAPPDRPAAQGDGAPPEEVVEVKGGFLGLKHLYLPVSAVLDVDRDAVMLGLRKSELEHGDWGRRPVHLDGTG